MRLRNLLLIAGKYPTDPGGAKVFEGMKALNEALERCAEKKGHLLLLKLLRITSARKEFEPQYKKVKSLLEFQNRVRETLAREDSTSARIGLGRLVSKVEKLSANEKDPEIVGCLETFAKITRSHWKGLFYCMEDPRIPRTNVTIEVKINRMKRSYRRISGRKNWHRYLVRFGPSLALLEESWTRDRILDAAKRIPYEEFRKTWSEFKERKERLRRLRRAGKSFSEFLRLAEKRWT